MMFDDNDVQRLKNNIEHRFQKDHPNFGKEIVLCRLEAKDLLARLEAAEFALAVYLGTSHHPPESVKAWRKSKGETND